jgi:hypothetical protein
MSVRNGQVWRVESAFLKRELSGAFGEGAGETRAAGDLTVLAREHAATSPVGVVFDAEFRGKPGVVQTEDAPAQFGVGRCKTARNAPPYGR